MQTFNIMDLLNPANKGAHNPGNQNQMTQSEGQNSDFLMALLSKLLKNANQISMGAQGQGETGGSKESAPGTKESSDHKTDLPSGQAAKGWIEIQSLYPLGLLLEKPDPQQDQAKGGAPVPAKETDDADNLSLSQLILLTDQTFISTGDQTVLNGSPTKEAGIIPAWNIGLLLGQSAEAALNKGVPNKSQALKDGTSPKGTPPGKENPVLTDTGLPESIADLLAPQVTSGKKEGLTVNQPKDGTVINVKETSQENSSLINLLDPAAAKNSLKKEENGHGSGGTPTAKDSLTPSLLTIDNAAGKGMEKGNEYPKGSPFLFQGDTPPDPQNPLLSKTSEDLKIVLERGEGSKNKESVQRHENSISNQPGNFKSSEINNTPGNAFTPEKISFNKANSLEHPQRAMEMTLPQDQVFTIKRNGPSSLEVSLEPDGLGKLNIELKLTDHHLHAQIMVNDSIGKKLIENNLPQLLSELGKEGLQIGEFSVSLKNQGRDQNPVPIIQSEPRGQPATVPEVGGTPSASDNHLVHIII
jgi:flagellar hook-length control protein FliK